MSIEVVGVNQSWTQLSSILLPVSTASPATSRNSTTTTTKTSPLSPARSEKAITLTETIDDSGNSPLSTEPPSDPLSDSCLAVSSIEDDGQGSNENGEIEEADLSQLTATAENGDEVGQQQDQQLLSATLLPPLPDLIPIRRSQQLQLQEIDVNSCDTNQQQDRKSEQQPQSPTSASSQILSISNKQPVEVEEENRGGEEDQVEEEEEEDQTINYDDTTSNNNERDDPQHSTFEEATSTSLATTSTVLDNQSTITASTTTTATTFSLYPTDSNMSQQHSSSMLLDTALTAVPSLTGLPKTGAKKRGRKIKTEIEDPELCPIPHRKSDRRRVARDIFLVFEEHPANRRRGKGGKAKQPKTRPKSKFAHLMTEPKRHNKKGATAATVGTVPPVRIKSEPKTPTTTCNTLRKNTPSVAPASVVKTPATKTSTPKATPASKSTNSTTVPRVKPIFLFVKQDDTRIVEVRCEDYDKRNRIRLTKTANGWRAIPRTDPSSTRFAKLLPNPAVKVKQEMIEEALRNAAEVPVQQKPPPSPSSSPQQPEPPSSPIPTAETEVVAPLEPLKPLKILQPAELLKASLKSAASHAAKKKKKKKKKKKRKLAEEHLKEQKEAARVEELEESDKHHSIEEDEEEEEQESEEPHAEVPQNPIISTEPNHLVYESTNHEREEESLHEEHDTEIKQIDDDDDEEVQEVPIAVETPEIIKQPELTPEAEDEDVEEVIPQYEEDENGLMLHHHHMEPNNNEPTEELAKNLTQISDDLELDEMPQFMQDVNAVRALQLCPETGLFIQKTSIVGEDHGIDREPEPVEPELNHHEHEDHEDHDAPVVLSDSFDDSDVDTKNLKDLIDDADLLQHCSDNAMSGAELLDSLVKRGCEDNHISGDEPSIKETICLDDFENEDDDVLMQPEPVADIISRLGGSLAASPKCLSFNEAGEIEGLHGELFQSNTQNDPFSRHTLEELSITIKDLEKSAEESYNSPVKQKPAESVTIVSPDSCVDEMPKDLTCKKSQIAAEKEKPSQPQPLLERPNSRSSDAIQSPQPSGLPAVPPSPDLVHSNKSSKNVFLEQLLNASNSISPKICSSVTVTPIKIPNAPAKQQQKEPLDLGKHRKSASPTVSCSEEAKRIQTVTIDEESPDEPLQKRIKREEIEEDIRTEKSHTDNLIEMLSSGKDPDPLTQLRLLIRNPEWKVPDPILVPKDRLSAVLASPAREIPLLLTTRPELRLPEAFAYPAILQDPDILVISMAQLETILQKQVEITRPKAKTPPIPQVTIEAIPNPVKNRAPPEKPVPAPSPDITVSSKKTAPSPTTPQPAKQQAANNFLNPLMGDIDAATLAAFNQMLWLPYIGQMAPEFIKAIAGLQNGNGLAELMPLLQQQQNAQIANQQQPNQKSAFPTPPQFHPMAAAAAAAGLANPLAASAAFQNPLEMAMWQEALTQAQMQRMMKLNAAAALAAQQQQQREIPKKSTNSEAKANTNRSHYGSATSSSKQTPSNPPPPYHHSQTSHQRHQMSSAAEKSNLSSARSVPNPFYRPPGTSNSDSSAAHRAKQKSQQHHQDQKPRVTCKSLSNLLQPERLSEAKMSNLMAMPGFDFGFNGSAAGNVAAAAAAANPFQFASAAAAAAAAASAGRTSSGTGQYGGSSSNSATGCGAGSANNVNHSAALHRTNHSASSMLGNMTPSQHQHQQLQHHQQQLQHHQLQHQHQQQQHQQQQQQQLHHQQQQQHQQQQAKLKVKPGSHLIDPAALQRRLLNCEDMSEVGSTTNGLEEMMTDPNAALWHPLFGNTQKAGYNSPWQWTTVTASGE